MKIFDASIKIIKDSRGKDTLEAKLYTDSHGLENRLTRISVSASAPSGKSRGAHEAFVLEPKMAVEKFEEIKSKILEKDFSSQEEFDNFLISLDGTPNKGNLGGNLTLVLSLAFARLKAKNENKELFQYIKEILNLKSQISNLPRPFFNVINGGAHATHPKSKLDFQEFQIIPDTQDFRMALDLGQEFYRKLREFLENKFGKENVMLGDEAGFSCPFKSNEEAIEILADLIVKYSYPLKIGLDAAATQFYKLQTTNDKQGGVYVLGGKECSAEELNNFYLKIIEAYGVSSIEDPFYEEAFDSFASLTALTNTDYTRTNAESSPQKSVLSQYKSVLVITDDLTTTDFERLKTAIEKKSGNAILIKPNQIGTLTETINVIKLAYENNWQAVVSHRSGETMDNFIADLAVGIRAFGIKAGAPSASERMAKYQRMLEIQNVNIKMKKFINETPSELK
ncbi:MAG: phosphopyruvate hydratase [Spirochaetia bacterium]|nr:MAG: phosphopyruvate hydratase [Spirochaetia bacterium]